jgi:hypothetical protein
MIINWKELFEGRNVFHCETQELAIELLSIAHNLGYKWGKCTSYLDFNHWEDYEENTCYNIKEGYYGTVNYYRGEKNIINVNDLLTVRKPFKLNRK